MSKEESKSIEAMTRIEETIAAYDNIITDDKEIFSADDWIGIKVLSMMNSSDWNEQLFEAIYNALKVGYMAGMKSRDAKGRDGNDEE